MTPNLGGWIHSFAITDTQLHKGGYTIYKITSIVFPRSVPQALSCLTVWKRFHEVKRLHRELARRYKSLNLPGQLPEPIDCSFFKRFDEQVISRRKDYILQLLDFAAQHPALFKCYAFSSFFSDGQQLISTPEVSPLHRLHLEHVNNMCKGGSGAIAEICDKLDLRYDPHDGEFTLFDPAKCDNTTKQNNNSVKVNEGDELSLVTVSTIEEVKQSTTTNDKSCKDYGRFLTPMASIESDDSDYIYEAALEFSHAVQAEANLEYKEAHKRYKRGVELLLNGSKDDSNDDRKFIARAKISKYLSRADDIYDKFLRDYGSEGPSTNKTTFQLSIDVTDAANDIPSFFLERPWNNLAKYKVIQVLGDRVMQVECITEPKRPMYVMKGIEKPSSNSPTQTIFLPQHVPYMVDLLAFFQCEQKIFLLLKQAEGGRLYDYIQSYTPTNKENDQKSIKNFSKLFPDLNNDDAEIACEAVDSSFVECEEIPEPKITETLVNESTDFNELVRCSQQLLASVSNTLKEIQTLEETPTEKSQKKEIETDEPHESRNKKFVKLPEASLKQWMRELACAIESLHSKGVILADLNMENLLLGVKGQLLITYFYQHEGEKSAENYIHKAYSDVAVLGHFVAPERPLTFKSDWWSYGVVLYQLLIGLPFKTAHPGHIELYGCIQYPEHAELTEDARDLLDNLLQQNAEARFDFEQIQTHAFFKGTNWEEVRINGLNVTTNKTTGV